MNTNIIACSGRKNMNKEGATLDDFLCLFYKVLSLLRLEEPEEWGNKTRGKRLFKWIDRAWKGHGLEKKICVPELWTRKSFIYSIF